MQIFSAEQVSKNHLGACNCLKGGQNESNFNVNTAKTERERFKARLGELEEIEG
jgi:hypothetical protein